MSRINVPEQRLESREPQNGELITKINHACEKLTHNISRMKEEQQEISESLKTWEYLSFDIKEAVREHYKLGIWHREQELGEMKDHLERLGVF